MGCSYNKNGAGEVEIFDRSDSYVGFCRLDLNKGFWIYSGKAEEKQFISDTLNVLNSQLMKPEEHYVYLVYIDRVLKYIGKGFGSRYQHSLSGTSHVFGLNKAYFQGNTIEVMLYADAMSEKNALNLESSLISLWYCHINENLFNTKSINQQRDVHPTETESSLFQRCKLLAVKVGFDDFYQDVHNHVPFTEYHYG